MDSPLPPPLLQIGAQGSSAEDDVLPALRKRLATLIKEFQIRITVLLGDLIHQPDHDMRWLAMVMNFNDVYQPKRRSSRRERDKKREKETPAARGGG